MKPEVMKHETDAYYTEAKKSCCSIQQPHDQELELSEASFSKSKADKRS